MPEAVVAIVIISILCGTAVKMTSMFLNHRRESKRLTAGGADSSIRASELHDMMRRAVAEGVEPLEKRLDELQAPRQLESAAVRPRLVAPHDSARDEAADTAEAGS